MINYFTLFSMEEKYFINKNELEEKYFKLSMKFHPDRLVGKNEKEKMQILSHSADINSGYGILSDDVERATHLMEIRGLRVNQETENTVQPSHALLTEQMELRERASEIESGLENKAELFSHVDAEFKGAQKDFDQLYNEKNFIEAAEIVIKMKYLDKLRNELDKF